MRVDKEISEDEAALYDRQIRLWGVDAQKKLLSSKVLLINMQGLGAEVAKNLVLSGINSLTLLDSNDVQENDLKYNFLIKKTSLNKNRAEACIEALQTLNPMVKISGDTETVKSKNDAYFGNFDIVCALSTDLSELQLIDGHCRAKNVLFLCGFVYGYFGFTFVDFSDYKYLVEAAKVANEEADKKNACSTKVEKESEKLELEQKSIQYKTLANFLTDLKKPIENLSAKKQKRLSKAYLLFLVLNAFFQNKNRPFSPQSSNDDKDELLKIKTSLFDELKLDQELLPDAYLSSQQFSEFTPVNAIMGGVMAQEIVKAISKKNEPVNNFFVFDGDLMSGEVLSI